MNEIIQALTLIVSVASAADAVLPPTDKPVLKQLRQFVSLLAVNIGHSQNVAPIQAAKDAVK
jgi:hypothetical protein